MTYRLAGHLVGLRTIAGGALVAALLVLVPRRAWRVGRLAVTAVHEIGHAAVAALGGRRVTAVHLRADTSGVTLHQGPRKGLGRLVTSAAGYPAPGLVGVAGAWLTAHHHTRIWLLSLLTLGVVSTVLWIRNLFGLLVMAGWVGGLGWLASRGAAATDVAVGAALAWFLLLGGLRASTELFRDRSIGDAHDLGRIIHMPVVLCKAWFFVVAAGTAAGGAVLLLGAR